MKFEILMECAKILNTVDIDDPKNQKAISVSESYIMHSYDLYKKNCIREGYEPISKEQYMLEVLNLNEGILKKVLGAAAVAGTAYAAAKGVNYVNQQAKFNTQNTNDQGQGSNGYQAGGGFQGFVNNAKAAYNQAGGVGNLVRNAAATGFGRVGQEQIANQHNVNTEYTDSEGNTQQRQTYSVGSRKDARKAVKQQDRNSTTAEYSGTPVPENNGNSSDSNNNVNQNGQTNQENTNNQKQTNTQGNNTQPNNPNTNSEQPAKQGIGGKLKEIGRGIGGKITGFFKSNLTKQGREEKRNKARQNSENAQQGGEQNVSQSGTPAPENTNNQTQTATPTQSGTQEDPKKVENTPQDANQSTQNPPVNNQTNTQTSQNNPTDHGQIANNRKEVKKVINRDKSKYKVGDIVQGSDNHKYVITADNDGRLSIRAMNEDYWWFDELPISARKSFLEAQNIHANEYFVAHGVKYKVNEYGNNWNRLSESNIFLEYLDLNNDDELISFAKARHSKVDYQSGKIDDIDFLQEAYQWDMISKDEYIEFMEMYSHSDEFYSVINYICENWYDTKNLREPLTPSMRMPAGYKY